MKEEKSKESGGEGEKIKYKCMGKRIIKEDEKKRNVEKNRE